VKRRARSDGDTEVIPTHSRGDDAIPVLVVLCAFKSSATPSAPVNDRGIAPTIPEGFPDCRRYQ